MISCILYIKQHLFSSGILVHKSTFSAKFLWSVKFLGYFTGATEVGIIIIVCFFHLFRFVFFNDTLQKKDEKQKR